MNVKRLSPKISCKHASNKMLNENKNSLTKQTESGIFICDEHEAQVIEKLRERANAHA